MKGDPLFVRHYLPGLIRNGVENVVLRIYKHIIGFATDDPENSTEIVFTPRAEVDDRMRDIFARTGEDRGMAITSIVSQGALQKYLFLLDCALPSSRDNDRELTESLACVRKSLPALADGMLLRTQASYHIVGFKPLSLAEWHEHMARAILLRTRHGAPIADVRYIGHSLEREYGSLRMSDYGGKPTPDFVQFLN